MKGSLYILATVAILLSLGLSIKNMMNADLKVGYVRNSDLMRDFKGMEEAENLFNERKAKWEVELQSMQGNYQTMFSSLTDENSTLTIQEKVLLKNQLVLEEQKIYDYIARMNLFTNEEDVKLTEGVLNQVNSLVKVYAEENNYEIILGTTSSGNIMYGAAGLDITAEVLKFINKEYSGR